MKQNLLAQTLTKGLRNLNGLSTPKYDKKIKTHSFYVYPLIYDQSKNKFKVSRKQLISKLRKRLSIIIEGYTNLHLLPIFRKKIAYGSKKSFPWILNEKKYIYKKGICPVAEKYHDEMFIGLGVMNYDFSIKDMNNIVKIFKEVWKENF